MSGDSPRTEDTATNKTDKDKACAFVGVYAAVRLEAQNGVEVAEG